jgi:transcriptional regulator with XRE-family HTH domain
MSKEINKDSIGYRLARIRFELGLNAKEYANILGIAQSSIGRYEKNERTPDYELLSKLVNNLGVNSEYIFAKSEIIFTKDLKESK